VISEELSKEELLFPSFGYLLDESDPDIVVLRRQDDARLFTSCLEGVFSEVRRRAELPAARWRVRAHQVNLGDEEEVRKQ